MILVDLLHARARAHTHTNVRIYLFATNCTSVYKHVYSSDLFQLIIAILRKTVYTKKHLMLKHVVASGCYNTKLNI
jgi:hypothetical protein